MAVQKGLYPGDLESIYTKTFSALIENINKEYIAELRRALKDDFITDAKLLDNSETFFLFNSIQIIQVRDLIFNSTPYRRVKDRLKKLRDKVFNKKLFKDTLKSMNNVLDRLAGRTARAISDQLKNKELPIPNIPLKANLSSLKGAIEQNIKLITTITDAQVSELEKAVLKSVTGGSSPQTVIEEVEKISDNGRNYAEFVARDQLAKTHAAINKDMQTRAGFPGYIWRITGDSRVRPDHREQKDKFFTWENPPALKNGNLHPGEDYQCRCIAEPAFGPE